MLKRSLGWFFSIPRLHKRILSVGMDFLLIALTLWLAFCIRYDQIFILGPAEQGALIGTALTSVLLFVRLGLYRAVIRFMSHEVVYTIFWGVTGSTLALVFFSYLFEARLPRSVIFIYWALAMVSIGGSRLMIISAIHTLRSVQRGGKAVIIFGAGDSGTQLCQALLRGRAYHPVAFIDEDPGKRGSVINGIPVHSLADATPFLQSDEVGHVLLAISNTSHEQRRRILRYLDKFPVQIQTIPALTALINGEAAITELRDIDIEDLLGRDPVPARKDLIGRTCQDRVVMITGAGGSIGSELSRQVLRHGVRRLVVLDICEYALYQIDSELRAIASKSGYDAEIIPVVGSVQKQHRMEVLLRAFSVEVVYHAAAYKHVPLVEQNIVEGVRNNVFGTWAMAEAAIRAEVRSFVLVSTDKAVRPTNVMGASKRMAELVLQGISERAGSTRFTMVRFGNVLGSSGSVVPLFRSQIRAGGPVTVTHRDVIRFFMTIPEAASLVLQAGAMGEGGEVFLLDMGEPVRIEDLARKMIRLMGCRLADSENPDGIEIRYTGLRPGEKLYEELLLSEKSEETSHPRIYKAREFALDWSATRQLLAGLEKACFHFDCKGVRDLLLKAPLNFRPDSACVDLVWEQTKELQLFTDEEERIRLAPQSA